VLKTQRDAALADIKDWEAYVAAGIGSIEEYANGRDVSLGLFEWSAPDGCEKNDVEAILQANPSIGHGSMTVESALADIRAMTDAGYRTEVLCQWVTAQVDSFIDVKDWLDMHVAIAALKIPKGSRTVWGVDTSADRRKTWLAAAVFTAEGKPFATVRLERAGMMWLPEHLLELARASGFWEVAVQSKGCPAVDFIDPLKKLGFTVHALEATQFALATGRIKDRVRDNEIVIVEQPAVDLAISGGVVHRYASNEGWDRHGSRPVDIAGLVAMTIALYALEVLKPEPKQVPPPPPPPAVLTRADFAPGEVNVREVAF